MLGCAQGEQLGDHWQLGKLGFFRQSREIPLIIRDPRPSADGGRGQRVEACTEHIDIAPTLIDAMGGVVPPVSSLCNCAERSAGFGRSGSDGVRMGRRWTAARCCRSCSTARSRRSTVGAQHRTTNTTSAPSPRPTSRRRSASGVHATCRCRSSLGCVFTQMVSQVRRVRAVRSPRLPPQRRAIQLRVLHCQRSASAAL